MGGATSTNPKNRNQKDTLSALGYGESLIPTIFHGKYYTGNVGEILQEVSESGSIYTAIDVSPFIGQSITIKLKSTNNSTRKFGFCNSESIIKAVYDEAYSRNNFVFVDGWYEGVIPIIDEKFFFSYSFAGAGSVDPEFLIPTQTPLFIDAREKAFNNLITNSGITIPQEDYYLIGSEKRIWFSKLPSDFSPALMAGDTIRVLNPTYSIGYRANNGIVNWSDKIIVGDNFIGYGIRKNDLSDISDMTQATIKNIVVIERKLYTVPNNNKKVHISLDDCVFWADLIENATVYKSAFQNPLLADLREIHYLTGATFTLNCFCTDGTHDISNVPETFKNDFSSNSDWLKFAFHAEDTSTHYNVDKVEEITASYQKFVNAIYKMTGNADCIDTITRLGFFTGTLNNVLAIRDQNCGINGLLTADDTRVSYYFDTTQNDYMILKGRMYDNEHNLLLIKTQPRLEYVTDINEYCNQYVTPAYGNFINNLEFFTHEYEWNNTLKNKVLSLTEWLKAHSYQFTFWNK